MAIMQQNGHIESLTKDEFKAFGRELEALCAKHEIWLSSGSHGCLIIAIKTEDPGIAQLVNGDAL